MRPAHLVFVFATELRDSLRGKKKIAVNSLQLTHGGPPSHQLTINAENAYD